MDTNGRTGIALHRLAVLAAVCTLGLVFLGGSVTSNDAGMAVPDWPQTFGQNMFLYPPSKWVGDVFFEHTHRLLGATVGLVMIVLAVWTQWRESRASVRRLGWVLLAAVIVQGVMGGLRVTENNVRLAIVHGCFAQLFFSATVCMAIVTSAAWWDAPSVDIDATRGDRSSPPPLKRWATRASAAWRDAPSVDVDATRGDRSSPPPLKRWATRASAAWRDAPSVDIDATRGDRSSPPPLKRWATRASAAWRDAPAVDTHAARGLKGLCIATNIVIFCQLILGAIYRHLGQGLAYHIIGAVVVTIVLSLLLYCMSGAFPGYVLLSRLTRTIAALFVAQLALGVGAVVTTMSYDASRPATFYEWFVPSAHVAVGASILAFSIALTLSVYRVSSEQVCGGHTLAAASEATA